MEDSFIGSVKQAFHEANVCHDCEFVFLPSHITVAAITISQCIVAYKDGNEYLRLDILIAAIKHFADIGLIEFRGRGGDNANQLLIELKIDGVPHQIIYLLPPNTTAQ
jgi:hypothetical protein